MSPSLNRAERDAWFAQHAGTYVNPGQTYNDWRWYDWSQRATGGNLLAYNDWHLTTSAATTYGNYGLAINDRVWKDFWRHNHHSAQPASFPRRSPEEQAKLE